MVATKGRTLLIEVHSLDASGPPPSAALHAEIRAAVQRADAASGDNAVQSRMYSREARLSMDSRLSRDAGSSVGSG